MGERRSGPYCLPAGESELVEDDQLGISEAPSCAWPGASLIKAGAEAPLPVILQRIECASNFSSHFPQPVL